MEVGNATDHGGTGDKVVAVGKQRAHEVDIARVAFDEPIARVVVVAAPNGSVFRVVVDADHFVAALEKFLDEIATNEAGRTADADPAHVILGLKA